MKVIRFFLEHHHKLYFETGGVISRIDGLTDEQMRLCQHNLNSIAWILWHMARCEDVAINRLIFDHKQILDTDKYSSKLKVLRRDIGTSMTYQEVLALSNKIDIVSLREYNIAVATKTQKVIRELPSEQLNQIPSRAYLKKVLFEEGALYKNSYWVAEHYSNKTKGWFLGHLGLTHGKGHLGQILIIRKLQGLGSGGG